MRLKPAVPRFRGKHSTTKSLCSLIFDDMINIVTLFFKGKANNFDTKVAYLGLHLSISKDIVSTINYDKCDDFEFVIIKFFF